MTKKTIMELAVLAMAMAASLPEGRPYSQGYGRRELGTNRQKATNVRIASNSGGDANAVIPIFPLAVDFVNTYNTITEMNDKKTNRARGCRDCVFFKHYNFFTGNVHCEKGIRQFAFGENLVCPKYKEL